MVSSAPIGPPNSYSNDDDEEDFDDDDDDVEGGDGAGSFIFIPDLTNKRWRNGGSSCR
jgi:hypothetical protein